MAGLSDAEARLVLASAGEAGRVEVGKAVDAHGAIALVESDDLADELHLRIDFSVLERKPPPDARWITPASAEWPRQMEVLQEAQPLGLWVRGKLPEAESVSIVGARSSTEYGERVAEMFAADLAANSFAVISGGAYGIDAAAHRGAIALHGCTVAVLASSVDLPYPRSNHVLFERILERGGALVSEAPLNSKAQPHRFLIRNRLIAAWGKATVVIESRERSGALSTARGANDLGRPVLAVPGSVMSPMSAGNHLILRDFAILARNVQDVVAAIDADEAEKVQAEAAD